MKRSPFWVLLFIVFSGCSRNDLANYYQLGDLRILSLRADKPEVNPGDTVTLTPFLSDVTGAGRALTYHVEACQDPGIEIGVTPSCDGRLDRVVLADGLSVSGLSSPDFTGDVSTIAVTVPSDIFAGHSAADQNNGVAYLVFYKVTPAGGVPVKSFKRIFASSRALKNKNPSMGTLLADGISLTAAPTANVKLSATYLDSDHETFSELLSDGSTLTKTEEMLTTWFFSDGDVDKDRTAEGQTTLFTPGAAPVNRHRLIIAVTRDRRGGEAIQMLKF